MLPKLGNQIRMLGFWAVGLLSVSNAQAQWKQDRFIIGTFYDPRMPGPEDAPNMADTTIYTKKIALVKAAYFNLMTGMDHTYNPRFVDYKLRVMSSLGLKTLLMNEVSWAKGNNSYSNAKANQWLSTTTTMSAPKKRAFEGYFVYDEPSVSRQDDIKNWINYIKSSDPNKLAYVNLLNVNSFPSCSSYESYLDDYLSARDFKLDVASFDFYPFVNNGQLRPNYFYNLRILQDKAKGRPVWCYVLTTKHATYDEINEYKMNFMIFAPLAYGVKGILYFTYATIPGATWGEALVDLNDKPTKKYYQVQKVNRFLSKVWGPIAMSSANLGVFHVSKQPFTSQDIDDSQILDKKTLLISDISNENMMAGIFKSQNNAGEYNLMIVNKLDNMVSKVKITLKGNFQNKVSASVPYSTYKSGNKAFNQVTTTYNSSSKTTSVILDFDAGEGRILKVRGPK
ncbi:hypothetical protein GA0116948_11259 [Chitinophaga costaii]|uniref:Glycoside hydrolase family 42 N-terminal domain-containing protein n=1 Tax=Chitinophaga costaii TaxID=1335309 RepID=A0A1C4F853_9BACT|nr:hypothetical protein [Chitinophaga costaii]PUZ21230.1 hypothetical protein DCM91_16955 [Chitinophaga costaii]SCC51691.1 hypothetical protein GA0116948_11259 [Chitinophaga costaii]